MTTEPAFDFEALMNLPWVMPTASLKTPAALVRHGAPERFVVRMASAEEMVRANDARASIEKIRALIESLGALGAREQATAFKAALGLNDDPPEGFIKQIELVILCTVSPPLDRGKALWLSRFQSFFFKSLFEKIVELCMEGATPGEALPSTEIPASK